MNYIVHCLLPKTIKPTLWTSRDFSQSVSNIGLYDLWQGGIFTNFTLAFIPVRDPCVRTLSPTFFAPCVANPHLAARRSEQVSLKKLDICVFSLTPLEQDSPPKKKNASLKKLPRSRDAFGHFYKQPHRLIATLLRTHLQSAFLKLFYFTCLRSNRSYSRDTFKAIERNFIFFPSAMSSLTNTKSLLARKALTSLPIHRRTLCTRTASH